MSQEKELFNINEVPTIGAAVGMVLNDHPPHIAQSILGGTVGNMVGNISDAQWAGMMVAVQMPPKTEDIPMWLRLEVMNALNNLREEWKRKMDDEKGFPA